ncbi:MAG TPA: hypothetical protein VK888_05200, partial [Anaerolineales bacterium]|nr:hypothetical protein [Anaerolineales bacterium]
MDSKFFKSIAQKKQSKDTLHISGVAGTLFGLCLVIALLSAVFGDNRFSDGLLGAWVVFWILVGTYILYALKVASQWEKAVVLR